jgi:hypothetical protein
MLHDCRGILDRRVIEDEQSPIDLRFLHHAFEILPFKKDHVLDEITSAARPPAASFDCRYVQIET